MREAVKLHVKSSLEDGDEIHPVFSCDYELVDHFDTEGLLNYYKGGNCISVGTRLIFDF
jgi:hypothetical protein